MNCKLKVLFLVEIGRNTGLGHMRRMQVLARAMSRHGWNCKFGVSDSSTLSKLPSDEFSYYEWRNNGLNLGPTDVLVVDGYEYNPRLLEYWRKHAIVNIIVDDIAERPIDADILLNHNIYGNRLDYSNYNVKHLLLGPEFSLVDNRFLDIKNCDKPNLSHILISFGGTDDGRYSMPIASAILFKDKDVVIDVVISPFCKTDKRFDEIIKKYKNRIKVHIGADMVELMKHCSIIVGAAGFTIIEALAAGLQPIVCSIADNQKFNIKILQELGMSAIDYYDSDALAAEAVEFINSARPKTGGVIDGKGADRVVNYIKEVFLAGVIK